MAEDKNNEKTQEEAVQPGQPAPLLQILAQYTKDQSFENPNAPDSLRSEQAQPSINISIEIGRTMKADDAVEVVLMLKADARRDDQVVYIAELEYAGLFAFQNADIQTIQPLIMVECPRLLFPFARQIMAEMTQNGGFMPLMLEPPDFTGMFMEEMRRRAAEAGELN